MPQWALNLAPVPATGPPRATDRAGRIAGPAGASVPDEGHGYVLAHSPLAQMDAFLAPPAVQRRDEKVHLLSRGIRLGEPQQTHEGIRGVHEAPLALQSPPERLRRGVRDPDRRAAKVAKFLLGDGDELVRE